MPLGVPFRHPEIFCYSELVEIWLWRLKLNLSDSLRRAENPIWRIEQMEEIILVLMLAALVRALKSLLDG